MRRVVVTGIGAVTPLASGAQNTWQKLLDGQSGIKSIDTFDVSDIPAKIAGLVPRGVGDGLFNAEDHVSIKDMKKMDDFIVYGVAAADQALADSGWKPETDEDQENTGVLIGSGIGGLPKISEATELVNNGKTRRVSPFFIPSCLINLVSGQVSIKHGLKGPNHAVVTACSTGAHAIGDASRMIMLGDADVMVAGGLKPLFAGWVWRALLRRVPCPPVTTIPRPKHRAPGIRAVTVLSWGKVPVVWCLKNTSTPKPVALESMPKLPVMACRVTLITSRHLPKTAMVVSVRCAMPFAMLALTRKTSIM
jgi:hypothetical protein